MNRAANAETGQADTALTLFVAGDSPRSLRARSNLARMQAELQLESLAVRVVDVLREPTAAASEAVFATPALIAWVAGRRHVLVGDLSDAGLLRDLLERMVA